MSPESPRCLPEWAKRERHGDMGWITENIEYLWPAAQAGYQATGRGAITVDTTDQPGPGLGNPFGYLAYSELEPLHDEDMLRMLRAYDPAKELVVVLFKSKLRTSTYRLHLLLPQ